MKKKKNSFLFALLLEGPIFVNRLVYVISRVYVEYNTIARCTKDFV